MELIDILNKLMSYQSPSGFERTIQVAIEQMMRPYADEITYDIQGNLICLKKSESLEHAKTLMLISHVDEVGLMVSHIEDSGFLRFTNIGGVDISILRGRTVQILHKGTVVTGVIGSKPIHMIERGVKDVDVSELWIDIGAVDKNNALDFVSVGDPIVLESSPTLLANGLFCGRGCDDKVGIAILIKVLEQLNKERCATNLVFVSSVQEEVGFRGATTSAYSIKPDICIALDVAHATDYPGINKAKYGDVQLGNGAAIPIGTDFTSSIQNSLVRLAVDNSLPYQVLAQPGTSGTDIHAIQVSRGGCACGLVSIPCRYMHTPSEIISLSDVEDTVKLLLLFCRDSQSLSSSL